MAERANGGRARTRSFPRSSDWFNFGVAFIATMCAVWAPRIASVLLSELSGTPAILFDQDYIVVSILFGAIVAVVIMFQKWEQSPHPWNIFIGALAVPSLLAGVFNSTAVTYEASALQSQIQTIQSAAENSGTITFGAGEIPVLRAIGAGSLEFIDELGANEINGSLSPGLVISAAYAQSSELQKTGSAFYGGLKFQQSQALIVLETYATKEAAITGLVDIRANVPESRAVKMGGQYYVLESTRTRPFAGALEEAIRLQEKFGYSPAIFNLDIE